MKTINFDHTKERLSVTKPTEQQDPVIHEATKRRVARNQREDLIEQIVAQCTFRKPGEDRKLARLLAIAANTAGWTATDLHALLRKREDPTIRNYTRFVWWSAKVKRQK